MFKKLLVLCAIVNSTSVKAYIDTTPKGFQKPKPIKTQAYKYHESKVDKYINITADKVGGSFLGTVIGGPTALIMKLSNKAFKTQEAKEEITQ